MAPASPDVRVSVETITPDQATAYLKLNNCNRPLNLRQVERWANVLRSGEWELNGSTIVLNGTRLIDGQHRLQAVVASGIPMTTVVVRDVDPKVFDTIDVGRKRTGMDALAIAGYKNTSALATAARDVWLYQQNAVVKKQPTDNRTLLQVMEEHPCLVDSLRYCEQLRCGHLSPSLMSSYHYLFTLVDAAFANNFIYDLSKGTGLQAGDPVYLLRERFISSVRKGYSSSGSLRLDGISKRALLIKAFNARYQDRNLRYLRWSVAEDFPTIYGLSPEAVSLIAAGFRNAAVPVAETSV
jgi:hypothetical protein